MSTLNEIAAEAVDAADEISDKIIAGRYRASLSDVETLRNHVRKLAKAVRGIGYPAVEVAVGDAVEAKVWQPARVTWAGDWMAYVETADGKRHKVERFASHLRIPK